MTLAPPPIRTPWKASPGQGTLPNGQQEPSWPWLRWFQSIQQQINPSINQTEFDVWSGIAPTFPVTNFPQGNDLVFTARGPADLYIEHQKVSATTMQSLSVGFNNNILISSVTVGNVTRGIQQTGNTSILTPSAGLYVGRNTNNEESISPSNWSIVDSTHINITCAKTHSGTTDIEQLGSTLLTSADLFINSQGVHPSQDSTDSSPLRIKDSQGNISAYFPANVSDVYPQNSYQFKTFAVAPSFIISPFPAAPASSASPGIPGQILCDAGFVYVCVANNLWKRASLSNF